MVKAIILGLSLMLAACQTTAGVTGKDHKRFWCDTNTPNRTATVNTPRKQLDRINAHNRKGEVWCGWKAK